MLSDLSSDLSINCGNIISYYTLSSVQPVTRVKASIYCSFNYTFLENALTTHSNLGLSIEAVVSFPTVVDERYALQVEQVSIPVSEKVLWTLPIR